MHPFDYGSNPVVSIETTMYFNYTREKNLYLNIDTSMNKPALSKLFRTSSEYFSTVNNK